MASEDALSVRIQADLTNLESQLRKFDKLLADSANNAGRAMQTGANQSSRAWQTANDHIGRGMQSVQAKAESLKQSLDPLYAAQVKFNEATGLARALLAANAINFDTYSSAIKRAETDLQRVAGEAGKTGAALNRMQLMELEHSARAAFDAIGAGASPLRVLQFEGPRLAQALGSGEGGLAGGFKSLTGHLR